MGEFINPDSQKYIDEYDDKSKGCRYYLKWIALIFGIVVLGFIAVIIYILSGLSNSITKQQEKRKEDEKKYFQEYMQKNYHLLPGEYEIVDETYGPGGRFPKIMFRIHNDSIVYTYEAKGNNVKVNYNTPTPSPIPTSAEPVRNLNGLEITLVDWFSTNTWTEPYNAYEEADWDMQNEAMKKHNYTFTCVQNDWKETWSEEFLIGVSENNPMGSIVAFDNYFIASLLTTGAFLDVSNLPSIDWSDKKYNQAVIDVMSYGGGIYGFANGFEPGNGVFFNKTLFRDAGLEEELPYDLQASGEWTFDAFKELCKTLTRDIDNDGVTDVYGVTGQKMDFFQGLLVANDTYVVTKESGRLVMNANDKKVLEALSFGHELISEGYYSPRGNGEWDYFKADFYRSRAAMYVEKMYACDNINDKAPNMEYGFVNMPKGPSAKDYVTGVDCCGQIFFVMPNCDKIRDVADDIAFAYDIYSSVPEEYRDDDIIWKSSMWMHYIGKYNLEYRLKDKRSVTETCNWMLNKWDPYMIVYDVYIPNNWGWLFHLGEGMDPQETIDAYTSEWQRDVDEFNRKLK